MASTLELVFQPILKLFRGNAPTTPLTISNPSRLVQNAPVPSVERGYTQTHVQAVHVKTEVTTEVSCGFPEKPTPNTLKKSGTCTSYQQTHKQNAAMLGPLPGTTICGSAMVQTFLLRAEPTFSSYCTVVRPKDQMNPVVRRVSKKYRNGAGRMNSMRRRARADSGSLALHSSRSAKETTGDSTANGDATSWANVFNDILSSGEPSNMPYPTDGWDRLATPSAVIGVEYTVQSEGGIFGSCSPRRRRQERIRH